MKRNLKYFFDKWWPPVLLLLVSCLIFVLSENFENEIFNAVSILLLGIGLLLVIISAFYSFIRKKWLIGLFHLAIFGLTIIGIFLYAFAMFWIGLFVPDNFARNLKIPENIELEEPADTEFGNNFESVRPDSITNRIVTKTDFQLYNSFQPGLYEYDFWTNKIDSGIIYLKAFEITHEYPLTANRLPKTSSVKIYNPKDSIMKFSTTSHFTIYEGDWGQYYAARFEVWYKPDNGGSEQKLIEKNNKIEGCQR